MSTKTDLILLAGLAVAGYLLWKKYNPEWSPADTQQALKSAGFETRTTDLGTFARSGNTTYKLDSSLTGADSPNIFQKMIIGADSIVPGTFLTRWAFG